MNSRVVMGGKQKSLRSKHRIFMVEASCSLLKITVVPPCLCQTSRVFTTVFADEIPRIPRGRSPWSVASWWKPGGARRGGERRWRRAAAPCLPCRDLLTFGSWKNGISMEHMHEIYQQDSIRYSISKEHQSNISGKWCVWRMVMVYYNVISTEKWKINGISLGVLVASVGMS